MKLFPLRRAGTSGFTLLELLIVMVIVATLATIAFPLFGHFRKRAQFVTCVSRLRVLHGGFMGHMMDNDMVWPQMPPEVFDSLNEDKMWEWYIDILRPYGIGKQTWTCPTDVSDNEEMFSEDKHVGSFIPTLFDERPNTAFLWGNQPWLIERGEMHGKGDGPNIVMPDGSVRQGPALFPK